jgi:drug/metabolite transporter (DMT)-like permease
LLAIGPQLLGHSSYNWSLAYLPAAVVSVFVLAEPIFASLLAWIVLEEAPPNSALIGGLVILAGVGLVALSARRSAVTSPH